MALQIGFWALAALTVGSALAVVLVRDLFRAALFLVLCFFGVAGLFITLNADFLAAAQVLIYVGAISILLIFAIMLTREVQRGSPSNRLRFSAVIIAGLLLATLLAALLTTSWPVQVAGPAVEQTTGPIAETLFSDFVLPFEIASVLLVAVIIGAIVLVREKEQR